MIVLGTAVALAIIWLLGALILGAAGLRERGGADVIVADFATGTVVLAFTGMLVIVTGLTLSILPMYALVIVLAGILVRKRRRLRATIDLPVDSTARGLIAAGGLVVIAILLLSTQDRLWWDGWAIWAFKARVLFLENTLPSTFLDPAGPYAFTHLDYPLAVPLLDWWVYRHAMQVAPALASFVGAVWFALLVVLVWGLLRRRVDERLAAAAGLGAAAFWPISFYATGGTADVVIALALLGATAELARAFEEESSSAMWRAAIYLTLGALSKNEGLALAVLAAVIGGVALVVRGSSSWRRYLPLALPVLALLPWLFFRSANGLSTATLSWPSITTMIERLPTVLRGLAIQGTTGSWLPIPFLAAIGISAVVLQGTFGLRAAWLLVGSYFGSVLFIYLIAPHDVTWLIVTSLPRVLGAIIPATVVLTIMAVFTTEDYGGADA